MCTFLQKYGCIGIYTVAQQICGTYFICKKTNKQNLCQKEKGERPVALRPFQCMQAVFAGVPPVGCLECILILVDQTNVREPSSLD